MNAFTPNDLDARIRELLDDVDRMSPPAPAFDDLVDRAPLRAAPDRGRLLAGAAAVGLVAAGVAGLIVLRDDEPLAPADGGPAVSAPVASPSSTEVGLPSDPLITGSLLTTPLAADAVPYIAAPGYRLEYATGETFARAPGDLEDGAIFVADGPTWGSPLIAFAVIPTVDSPVDQDAPPPTGEIAGWDDFGAGLGPDAQPVRVGDVDGLAAVAGTTGGPSVQLFWPARDGNIVRVNSVGLSLDEVVAAIEEILVDPADLGVDPLELETPVGFRALPMRTGTVETAYVDVRLVTEGREIGISAQNTGASGAFRSGALVESTENRVVDGVDVALRSQPEESGAYLADWFVGDWSFRVEGRSFADEQAFLDVLPTLELTSPEAFAESAIPDVEVVLPGDASGLLAELLRLTPLDEAQTAAASFVDYPTIAYNVYFEATQVAECAWLEQLRDARTAGDTATQDRIKGEVEVFLTALQDAGQPRIAEFVDEDILRPLAAGDLTLTGLACPA